MIFQKKKIVIPYCLRIRSKWPFFILSSLSFFFSHMSYPILYSGIHHNVFVSFDKSRNNAAHCLHAPKIFYTELSLFFFPMVISYLYVTLHAPTITNLFTDDRAKHHNQWWASTSSSIICIVTLFITRYYNSIHFNVTITPVFMPLPYKLM